MEEDSKGLRVKVTRVSKTVIIAAKAVHGSTDDCSKLPCCMCTVGNALANELERNRLKTLSPEHALRDAILLVEKDFPGTAEAISGYSESVETHYKIDLGK